MDDINKKKNDFISYCLTKDNSFPNYLLPRINIGCKLEAVFKPLPKSTQGGGSWEAALFSKLHNSKST